MLGHPQKCVKLLLKENIFFTSAILYNKQIIVLISPVLIYNVENNKNNNNKKACLDFLLYCTCYC